MTACFPRSDNADENAVPNSDQQERAKIPAEQGKKIPAEQGKEKSESGVVSQGLFNNCTIAFHHGRTGAVSLKDLQRVVVENGGRLAGVGGRATTHIICCNLTAAKTESVHARGAHEGVLVRPEWIERSVVAQR